MSSTTLIFTAVGFVVAATAWGLFARRRGQRTEELASVQMRRVRVSGGYQPSEIHVKAGVPIRLVFRREEATACSERVVFPDLGISAGLSPFQDVAVDLPASEPGAHSFHCQMDVLHGRLVVEPEDLAREPAKHGAVAA